MASATRISRRKESARTEIESAALLVGLKQPLFSAQGRSSSVSCRAGAGLAVLALSCVFLGFSLASAFYRQRSQQCGTLLYQEGGRFLTVQVRFYTCCTSAMLPSEQVTVESSLLPANNIIGAQQQYLHVGPATVHNCSWTCE